MGKTEKNGKKITQPKYQKPRRRKYGTNKTLMHNKLGNLSKGRNETFYLRCTIVNHISFCIEFHQSLNHPSTPHLE